MALFSKNIQTEIFSLSQFVYFPLVLRKREETKTKYSAPKILEKPLEKKAGKNYGPPGNKKLVYFIDDINMPEVDLYGTVGPHTLIRQHLDYNHW